MTDSTSPKQFQRAVTDGATTVSRDTTTDEWPIHIPEPSGDNKKESKWRKMRDGY